MKSCLLCVSLMLCMVLLGCSAQKTGLTVTPSVAIVADTTSQKYNLQLDFMKNHLSGILVIRKMTSDEIRLVALSHFGLSIFDFSFQGEQFIVNSCIEPLRKEKVLRLLEKDFRLLLLSQNTMHITEKNAIFEERKSGRGFGKTIVRLSVFAEGQPQKIQIKHPWLRLKIGLDKLID